MSEPRALVSEPGPEDLILRARGYTPEWHPAPGTPGHALAQAFARYIQLLKAGLAQAPNRSFMAFLEMLGVELLPAQAGRAPLVFTLMDESPVDVTLPEKSQVAATPAQPAPSRTSAVAESAPRQPLVFSTERTITLCRAKLNALYSVDPGRDEFADHTSGAGGPFTLFGDMRPTEHALYLGHDELFALAGDITVILAFSMASSGASDAEGPDRRLSLPLARCACGGGCHGSAAEAHVAQMSRESSPQEQAAARGLRLDWDYLTDTRWLPLTSLSEDDTTGGLRHDGQFILRRECGPNAKAETFAGRKTFWLRGRLATPLPPRELIADALPVINDIRASVRFGKTGLLPDAAFNDGIPLDTTKDFFPFGQQASPLTTFYLASKEVFRNKGANVTLDIRLSQEGGVQSTPLRLAWEYNDGTTWNELGITPAADSAEAYRFTDDGKVTFVAPPDWAEANVGGTKNYWLRVRLVEGDYGYPVRMNLPPTREITKVSTDLKVLTVDSTDGYTGGESVVVSQGTDRQPATVAHKNGADELVLTAALPKTGYTEVSAPIGTPPVLLPATLRPPVIESLKLDYSYLTDPEPLDHCLSVNDFVFEDHTEACRWPDQTFAPFRPVADRQSTVHLGFDRPLPAGLVSLLVAVPEVAAEEADSVRSSPFIWEYYSVGGWSELGVLDETAGFLRTGLIQFVGPPDAAAVRGLGGELFRIRARLKPGERSDALPLAGLWLNAVWANQSTTIDREPLGNSDGQPGQTLKCQRTPLLAGHKVEVQEWTGRGEHWRTFVQGVADGDLRFERDRATNEATAVWVRWHPRVHLHDSGPLARHYTAEAARGLIRFGDGRKGMIPPVGRPVAMTYRSGGGLAGNVATGAIHELHTAMPFVMGVTNPLAAAGGAAIESEDSVRGRGPQLLRHRSRAVSRQDIEWLARDASSEVARARCLPVVGPAGHAQRGWMTVLIVPHGLDARPMPSPELRRRVREYLAARVVAGLAANIRVLGPRYLPVSVQVECVPRQAGQAAEVEERLRTALNRFLHPLTGGRSRRGWDFGEPVHISQVARVIQEAEGVDHSRRLVLSAEGRVFDELVPVGVNTLVAPGEHELRLLVGVS